jgi:hypothetical protein
MVDFLAMDHSLPTTLNCKHLLAVGGSYDLIIVNELVTLS